MKKKSLAFTFITVIYLLSAGCACRKLAETAGENEPARGNAAFVKIGTVIEEEGKLQFSAVYPVDENEAYLNAMNLNRVHIRYTENDEWVEFTIFDEYVMLMRKGDLVPTLFDIDENAAYYFDYNPSTGEFIRNGIFDEYIDEDEYREEIFMEFISPLLGQFSFVTDSMKCEGVETIDIDGGLRQGYVYSDSGIDGTGEYGVRFVVDTTNGLLLASETYLGYDDSRTSFKIDSWNELETKEDGGIWIK